MTSPGRGKQEAATMMVKTGFAAAVLLALGTALAMAGTEGEFDNECVMGLALGKDIKTDCSVNTAYNGKTYCFGNETAKAVFLKRPEEFLTKAQVYYSSKSQ
jgi:YHS domain-containing protein